MTNGIRASHSSDIASEFVTGNPYYTPPPYPFLNPNFYHPPPAPYYTPQPPQLPPYDSHPPQPPPQYAFHPFQPPDYSSPPTPPYVYHHPQPPPYTPPTPPTPYTYTPPTPYTYPYLPLQSYNDQPISSCSMNPFVAATQFQPEIYAPQVFDESPKSPTLPFDDIRHQLVDQATELHRSLATFGEGLANASMLCEEMVSQASLRSSHFSAQLAKLKRITKTLKVGSEDLNQLQMSQPSKPAPLMFEEMPDRVDTVISVPVATESMGLPAEPHDKVVEYADQWHDIVAYGEVSSGTGVTLEGEIDVEEDEVGRDSDIVAVNMVMKSGLGDVREFVLGGNIVFKGSGDASDVGEAFKREEGSEIRSMSREMDEDGVTKQKGEGNGIEDNVSEVVTLQTAKTSALVNEPRSNVGKSNAFNFDPGGDISDVSLIEVKMKDAGTHLGLLYCGDQRLDIVALGIENVNGVILASEIDIKDVGVKKMALEMSPVVGEECKEEERSAFVSSCCVGADNVIVASSVCMQVEDVGIIIGTTIKSTGISPYYETTDASMKSYKRVESKNGIEGVSAEHGKGSQIVDNGSIFVRNVVYNGTKEAGSMIETDIKAKNSLQNVEENGDTKWNVREGVADNIKVGDSQVNPDFFFPGLGCNECRASSIRCEAIYQTYRRNDPRGDPARIVDVQGNVKSLIRTEPNVIANFHVDVALSTVVRAVMLVKNVNEVILLDVTLLSIELVTLGGVIGFREFLLSFCATRGSLSLNINISTMIIQLELVGLIIFNQKVMDLTKRIWCLDLELSGSNMVAVLCNMGPYLSKLMGSYVTGFQVASKEGVLTGEGMRCAYFEACEVVPHTHTLQISVGQEIPAVMTVIHASQRYAKLYLWDHVYLVGIQASEQVVLERIHTVSNLCQNPGHMSEEMQKPGTQGYYIKAIVLFVNVQFNFRGAALLSFEKCFVMAVVRTGVEGSNLYDFLNDGCMNLEVVKNSVYLGAELGGLDWTLDYDKVNVLNVEVVQIMKAYKYNVWGQGSPEMEKDFLTMEELCKSISFDRAIAYGDVFQAAISSGEESKVQELLLLDVTPLSLGIVMTSVVIVFILRNTTVPTKKKQVLSTYCDDQPGVMVHVFKCERTIIEDHKLLVMFDFSGTQFVAKRIALSWYCSLFNLPKS